jgi:hypothetical protein
VHAEKQGIAHRQAAVPNFTDDWRRDFEGPGQGGIVLVGLTFFTDWQYSVVDPRVRLSYQGVK